MNLFEKIFVKLFSLIILVLSVLIILAGFNIIEFSVFENLVSNLYENEFRAKTTVFVCAIFIIISLKFILTRNGKPKLSKEGIVLKNSSGKLVISRESLENLINVAAKDIPGAESLSSKTYLDLEQNLRVFVTVTVSSDVSIKELSNNLQTKIKASIKQAADLDVAEVDVKIKNIVNKKYKKEKVIKKESEEGKKTEESAENQINVVLPENIESNENKIEE